MLCKMNYTNTETKNFINNLIIGNKYYIRLQLRNQVNNENTIESFDICISTPVPPINDECINAITLPVNLDNSCALITSGSIESSTASLPADLCMHTNYVDVWYKFTATAPIQKITYPSQTSNTAFIVSTLYKGIPDSLGTPVLCRIASFSYLYLEGAEVGHVYYLRIHTGTDGTVVPNREYLNQFEVCISSLDLPPVNDECINAIDIPVNSDESCSLTTNAILTQATPSFPAISCISGVYEDVWHKFIATNTIHVIHNTNVSRPNTTVYSALY